jgi:hypothetical protein
VIEYNSTRNYGREHVALQNKVKDTYVYGEHIYKAKTISILREKRGTQKVT